MGPAPNRVLSLLVLATIANLPAVGGIRSVMSEFDEQDASEVAAEAVATFSVTDEQLKLVCTAKLEVQTCEALGASPEGEHPFASRRDLAATLSITEDQARALLSHLGLEPAGANGNFGCKEFCRAAVRKIPAMLNAAVPLNPGVACVDAACAKKLVQVSESALATGTLSSDVGGVHDSLVKMERPTWNATLSPLSDSEVFRMAVNVILGIFPSVGDVVEEEEVVDVEVSALVEQGGRRGSEEPLSVSLDSNLDEKQHALLRGCQAKAVAWVATAIRKLRPGHALVRKWFRLDRPEMAGKDKYVAFVEASARAHMQRMLTGLYKMHLMNNGCRDGVLAFTLIAPPDCDVDTVQKSNKGCGEMSGSGRHVIRLCDLYYEQEESRRVGTLVHEISHHFGTNDFGYDAKALELNTEEARDNADTYMRFVQELVQSKEAEDVFGTPDARCNTICNPLMFEKREMINRLPLNACGKCEVKSNPNTPLVGKLFGEGCGNGAIEVANTTWKHVCCTPYPCTNMAPAPQR